MEIDTSSYPKAKAPDNPLDTVAKVQQIQRNNIGIDQEKLKLYDQQYNIVHRGLGNLLAVPEGELTADHFYKFGKSMVESKTMTPEQYAQFVSDPLPTKAGIAAKLGPNASPQEVDKRYDAELRKVAGQHMLQAQDKHEAIQYFAGRNAEQQTGDQIISGTQGKVTSGPGGLNVSPFSGGKPFPGGTFTPMQQPPGATGVNPQNNPTFKGPNYTPPNTAKSNPLPIASPASPPPRVGEAGNAKERTDDGVADFRPAPSNNFTQGQQLLNEHLSSGGARLQAVKPAQQALKLMTPEILTGLTGTGPIADKLTKGISAVNGVLGLKGDLADRVAARQEIVKKMNAYVSNSPVAGRSNAAQTLAEASSPNANVQSLKALVELTRDAIALDRIHAAKALDFVTDDKGNRIKNPNYEEYPFKSGRFPNAVDEDAFKLDLMSKEERKALQERKEKESARNQQKFRDSVAIAKKLGMYD